MRLYCGLQPKSRLGLCAQSYARVPRDVKRYSDEQFCDPWPLPHTLCAESYRLDCSRITLANYHLWRERGISRPLQTRSGVSIPQALNCFRVLAMARTLLVLKAGNVVVLAAGTCSNPAIFWSSGLTPPKVPITSPNLARFRMTRLYATFGKLQRPRATPWRQGAMATLWKRHR